MERDPNKTFKGKKAFQLQIRLHLEGDRMPSNLFKPCIPLERLSERQRREKKEMNTHSKISRRRLLLLNATFLWIVMHLLALLFFSFCNLFTLVQMRPRGHSPGSLSCILLFLLLICLGSSVGGHKIGHTFKKL